MADGVRRRRIMVLEDEGLILLTMQDMLEDLGYEVAAAETQADVALAAIHGTEIDAALLDVNLGRGETSYPVAEALAARGIPFAFLTGYGSGGVCDDHRERPVLSKPVDEHSVETMLRQLLGGREAGGA